MVKVISRNAIGYRVNPKACQQSVHLTLGILRQSQAVFYTQAESCSRSFVYTRPPASNANPLDKPERPSAKQVLPQKLFRSKSFLALLDEQKHLNDAALPILEHILQKPHENIKSQDEYMSQIL